MTTPNLQGSTAIVSGASTGIGREIAKAFAAHGCKVALVARSVDGLKRTQDMIRQAGGQADIFPTDLSDINAIQRLGNEVQKRWFDVDIVVNVAGVWHDKNKAYSNIRLVDSTPEQINEVLSVGIRAPFLLTKLFLPNMMKKRSGKIIQISGWFSSEADAIGWLDYYVSKKAMEQFTAGLAEELREYEIQVNCISPGFVETDAVHKFYPDQVYRAISPVEIAKVALYLLSEEAKNITGSCTVVRSVKDY